MITSRRIDSAFSISTEQERPLDRLAIRPLFPLYWNQTIWQSRVFRLFVKNSSFLSYSKTFANRITNDYFPINFHQNLRVNIFQKKKSFTVQYLWNSHRILVFNGIQAFLSKIVHIDLILVADSNIWQPANSKEP